MPQIRMVVWNIENFGGEHQFNERGTNGQLLANVIRDFVRYENIDVLMILEVWATALPALQTLQATLNQGYVGANADWAFDWIKGSVASGVPYPPTTDDQLSWRGSPTGTRYEGYAIFWRSNRATFRLIEALQPVSRGGGNQPPPPGTRHYLELITEGLLLNYVSDQNYQAADAYNVATNATRPIDAAGAATNWSFLNFPYSMSTMFARPRVYNARRPAFAILELLNGAPNQSDRILPVIVYHAPATRLSARIGTYSTALSKQLNVSQQLNGITQMAGAANATRVNQAVVGGDFNWQRTDPPDWVYEKFTEPYRNDPTGGSNMSFAGGPVIEGTMVRLRERNDSGFNNGPQIEGAANADYVELPIDQLMVRGLAQVQVSSGRFDFLAALRASPPRFAASLGAYYTHFQQIIEDSDWNPDEFGPVVPPGLPMFGLQFTNWHAFYQNLARPRQYRRFTTARSAAEFYKIFISDHLPLRLTFNIA